MLWKKKKVTRLLGWEGKIDEDPQRLCEVGGKGVCTFHRFVDEDEALLHFDVFLMPSEQRQIYAEFEEKGWVPKCCHTEVLRRTYALVEYPDGSLAKVDPAMVCFLDREG